MKSRAEDYYEILGVKKDASLPEIRKKFKILSLKQHPDKNKNPKAKEYYTKIVNAYEVLKDPEKRKVYDLQGEEGLNMNPNMGNNQNTHHFYTNNFNGQQEQFFRNFGGSQGQPHFENMGFGGDFFNFETIFDSFPGFSNFGNFHRKKQKTSSHQKSESKFSSYFENTDFSMNKFGDLIEITTKNIKEIINPTEIWMLIFYYNENDMIRERETLIKLEKRNKGSFKIGQLDCSKQLEICKKNMKTHNKFETQFIIPNRKEKQVFEDSISVQNIEEYLATIVGSNVSKLSNWDSLISSPGKLAKAILFSARENTPLLWSLLSMDFKSSQFFGIANKDDSELVNKFDISKFPSIVLMLNQNSWEIYNGELTKVEIAKKMKKFYETNKKKLNEIGERQGKAIELTKSIIKDEGICNEMSSKICFIIVLGKATKFEKSVESANSLAEKYQKDPIHILQIKSKNLILEEPFNSIKQDSFIIILKPKRHKISIKSFDGNFRECEKIVEEILNDQIVWKLFEGALDQYIKNINIRTEL